MRSNSDGVGSCGAWTGGRATGFGGGGLGSRAAFLCAVGSCGVASGCGAGSTGVSVALCCVWARPGLGSATRLSSGVGRSRRRSARRLVPPAPAARRGRRRRSGRFRRRDQAQAIRFFLCDPRAAAPRSTRRPDARPRRSHPPVEIASMSDSSGMRSTLPERRRLMLPLNAAGFARNSAIIVRLISRREPPGVTLAGDAPQRVVALDRVFAGDRRAATR